MSIDFLAQRRAEEFHRAVEHSPAEVDARFVALVRLVGELREVEAPAPRPEFALALRERLLAEADEVLVPVDRRLVLPTRRTTSGRSRFAGAVVAAVMVAVPAGVAAAAQTAGPGETLYPLKRGLESVSEAVGLSDAARGERLLAHATERLEELAALGSSGDPGLVEGNLDDFAGSATRATVLLLTDYQDSADPQSVARLRAFAADSMDRVATLAATGDPALLPRYAETAQLLADLDQQARVVCSGCGPEAPLEVPEALSDEIALVGARTTLAELLVEDPASALAAAEVPAPAPSKAPPRDDTTGSDGAEGSQSPVDPSLAESVRDILGSTGVPATGSSAGSTSTPDADFDPAKVLGGASTVPGSTTRAAQELLERTGGAVDDTLDGVGSQVDETLDDTTGGLLP